MVFALALERIVQIPSRLAERLPALKYSNDVVMEEINCMSLKDPQAGSPVRPPVKGGSWWNQKIGSKGEGFALVSLWGAECAHTPHRCAREAWGTAGLCLPHRLGSYYLIVLNHMTAN